MTEHGVLRGCLDPRLDGTRVSVLREPTERDLQQFPADARGKGWVWVRTPRGKTLVQRQRVVSLREEARDEPAPVMPA